jgi:hypothetical protein
MEVDMLVELARPHAFDLTIVLGLEGCGRGRRSRRLSRHGSGGACGRCPSALVEDASD